MNSTAPYSIYYGYLVLLCGLVVVLVWYQDWWKKKMSKIIQEEQYDHKLP